MPFTTEAKFKLDICAGNITFQSRDYAVLSSDLVGKLIDHADPDSDAVYVFADGCELIFNRSDDGENFYLCSYVSYGVCSVHGMRNTLDLISKTAKAWATSLRIRDLGRGVRGGQDSEVLRKIAKACVDAKRA